MIAEEKKEYDRKRYLRLKEIINERSKKWWKKNGKEYDRQRYKEKRIERLASSKRSYEKYKGKRIAKGKEYRKKHPEVFKKAFQKYLKKADTRIKLNSRSRAGYSKIKKEKCKFCGTTERLEYHHEDYEKDKIIVLCVFCHKKLHRRGLSSIGVDM